MARPTTIKDEDLLRAARAVFLERGIQATTAEVAERAGVSEGTLFKRFNTKADLFRAAMSPEREDPPWIRSMLESAGKGDLKRTLVDVGQEALGFFRLIMPLIVMTHTNPLPGAPPLRLTKPTDPPVRTIKQVTGFFEAEMRAGRIKKANPRIVGRMFISAIMNQALIELVFKDRGLEPDDAEEFIRGVVHLLWEGIRPAEPARRKR